jgi:hypothetical protein
MTINIKVQSNSSVSFIKLDIKSDLDKITSTFNCYTDPALTDEAILDTSTINEDDDARATAIELFGEETWELIPDGLVLFHG